MRSFGSYAGFDQNYQDSPLVACIDEGGENAWWALDGKEALDELLSYYISSPCKLVGLFFEKEGKGILDNAALLKFSAANSQCLRDIAVRATSLAAELEKFEPSYDLAIAAGIQDCSYPTVRYGLVSKYRGSAIITMGDGKKWKAVGYGPTGGPDWIGKQGGITFSMLDTDEKKT